MKEGRPFARLFPFGVDINCLLITAMEEGSTVFEINERWDQKSEGQSMRCEVVQKAGRVTPCKSGYLQIITLTFNFLTV